MFEPREISLRERIRLNLISAMENAGVSQVQLAERLGISKGTVNNWARGNNSPDVDMVPKICNVLGISILDIYSPAHVEKKEVMIPEKKATSITDAAIKLAKDYDSLDTHGKRVVRAVTDEEKSRMEQEAAAARWRSGKQKQLMRFLRQKRRETEAADEPANVQRFPVPYYLQASSAGYGEWAESGYAEEIDLVKRPPFGTSFIVPVNGDSMEPTYPDGCKVFVRRQTEIRVGEVGIFFMDGKQWIKELGEGELISHNPAYPTRRMTDDICCQGLVLGICDDSYFAKAY